LTICNSVIQEILSPPHKWKFNRAELTSFITIDGQQDYTQVATDDLSWLESCVMEDEDNTSTSPDLKPTREIEAVQDLPKESLKDNPEKVCMLSQDERTQAAVMDDPSGIDAVETTVIVDSTSGFSSTGIILIESEMMTYSGTTTTTFTGLVRGVLGTTAASHADTTAVAAASTSTLRFWKVPSTVVWRAYVVYQLKPPIKTALTANWSPIPDDLAWVYQQGFLAMAYKMADDTRAETEYRKFLRDIGRATAKDEAELQHEGFFPGRPIMIG
jgi:hypothetical protein